MDDDDTSRRLLTHVIQGMGYQCEGANDGPHALEMIAAHPPEIVLLDLDMPGLNGAETCTRLRHHQREELRNIPVIMLTAHDGEREEVVCLAAGANDFVTKPYGRASLAARLATQLRLRALNETLRAQNDELERWRSAQIADLEAAQQVQKAILPAVEEASDWRLDCTFIPIIQVGGDIYGIEKTREGRLVWVADATGHGVAAALCTTLVALLFQRAAALPDPGGVLAQVNAEMLRVFHGRSMMSAACALLLPDGRVRYSGAGHPPLLIRRADGSVDSVASQGTLLGVLADATYATDTLQLATGEMALLFTDGLYSSRSAVGERMLVEDILPVLKMKHDIASLVSAMRGESAFDDDVTVIQIVCIR